MLLCKLQAERVGTVCTSLNAETNLNSVVIVGLSFSWDGMTLLKELLMHTTIKLRPHIVLKLYGAGLNAKCRKDNTGTVD